MRMRKREAALSTFKAPSGDPDQRRSPDPGAIFRLEVELVARFHAPGVVPGVDIAQGSVDAETRRRMGVGCHLLLERIGAGLRAPDLRPAEKHSLIARVAVENGTGLPDEGGAIGVEREQTAAEVGNDR